jgi:hypothetical protein
VIQADTARPRDRRAGLLITRPWQHVQGAELVRELPGHGPGSRQKTRKQQADGHDGQAHGTLIIRERATHQACGAPILWRGGCGRGQLVIGLAFAPTMRTKLVPSFQKHGIVENRTA